MQKILNYKTHPVLLIITSLIMGCSADVENGRDEAAQIAVSVTAEDTVIEAVAPIEEAIIPNNGRVSIRLGKTINTRQNEYFPQVFAGGKKMVFTGMDRTGHFGTRVDFTQTRDAGGEDIFITEKKNGVWQTAVPFRDLNTNYHESISHISADGKLALLCGNYRENLGLDPLSKNEMVLTCDLFYTGTQYNWKVMHFEEPVNSLYTEADGWMSADGKVLLFVSDRPGHIGAYHKKGLAFNGSFWGNTDIWVSLLEGGYWSNPVNLGVGINTAFAERTPALSADGRRLYFSSEGHGSMGGLDIFYSERKGTSWTEWSEPVNMGADINTPLDDWCFQLDEGSNTACYASARELGFTPTNHRGDGGISETNFRMGYKVYGRQSGSSRKEHNVDIYFVDMNNDFTSVELDKVLFEFDKAVIKEGAYEALDLIADMVSGNPTRHLEVIGHTDAKGSAEYNKDLSLRRAQAVKAYLTGKGCESGRITASSRGEKAPENTNETAAGRAENRRVEFRFI